MINKNSNIVYQINFIFIICLLLLSLQSFKNGTNSVIGNKIEDFSLRNIDGNYVSLGNYPDAKGFIIIFTCNHCPFAKLYTRRMNEINLKYKELNVPLIAVNPMDTAMYEEESFEQMQHKAKNEKFNFPYLMDAMQSVGKSFKAAHTPHTYIIWKEQKQWIIRYSGAFDDNGAEPQKVTANYLKDAVDELLKGKSVTIPETKTFGCAISYRKN